MSEGLTRYTVNVRLLYRKVAERGHRRHSGWARDLNLRGAWVELSEQVEPGSVLKLTLVTPGGNLALGARVAWASPGVRDARYRHGVRFTGVTPDQRAWLSTLFAHEKPLPARLSCTLAAKCQRTDKGAPVMPGIVRDLSDGGACVRLPDRVAPGTALSIRAATPFGKMTADGTVVWADPAPAGLPGGASYRHGLRFLHIHTLSELPLRALLLYGTR